MDFAENTPDAVGRDIVDLVKHLNVSKVGIVGDSLVWFYIDAPLSVCMARDPKGIYKRAQAGQVKQLLDYPFGEPRPQEGGHHVDTVTHGVEECHQMIFDVAKRELARG